MGCAAEAIWLLLSRLDQRPLHREQLRLLAGVFKALGVPVASRYYADHVLHSEIRHALVVVAMRSRLEDDKTFVEFLRNPWGFFDDCEAHKRAQGVRDNG